MTDRADDKTLERTLDKYRRRAIAAAGVGWGLDGFTWTMYGFAIIAAMPALGLTSAHTGWITAISIVASAVGGLLFGNLADRYGRVRMLTVVIIGYAVFTALTATSQTGWQFLLWRILEGLFFGGEWAVGAALVAEYARPSKRGRNLAFVQSCYAIGWAGSTLAYLYFASSYPPELAWRLLFLVGLVPAVFAVVIRLTTKDITELVPAAAAEKSARTTVRDLFAPGLARRTIFATMLGVGIQMIYYSVFVFFPMYMRQERGLSIAGTAGYTWAAIVGSFIGYLTAGAMLDWIGRRRTFALFFVGSAGSVVLFVLTPAAQDAAGIFIIVLLGFFSAGQSGGAGAYLAELFPTAVRATGQAMAYNTGRAIAAFGPLSIGYAAGVIGWGNSIMAVAVTGAIIGLAALSQLPETHRAQLVDGVAEKPD